MIVFGVRFIKESEYQAILGEMKAEHGKVLMTEAEYKAHRERYPLFIQKFANVIWTTLGGQQMTWTRSKRRRAWRATWPMFHQVSRG
jgi:hypothetical protein